MEGRYKIASSLLAAGLLVTGCRPIERPSKNEEAQTQTASVAKNGLAQPPSLDMEVDRSREIAKIKSLLESTLVNGQGFSELIGPSKSYEIIILDQLQFGQYYDPSGLSLSARFMPVINPLTILPSESVKNKGTTSWSFKVIIKDATTGQQKEWAGDYTNDPKSLTGLKFYDLSLLTIRVGKYIPTEATKNVVILPTPEIKRPTAPTPSVKPVLIKPNLAPIKNPTPTHNR